MMLMGKRPLPQTKKCDRETGEDQKVNDIQCLVVSSTIDYSTDLICYGLDMQGIRYLRINRDRFSQYKIMYF